MQQQAATVVAAVAVACTPAVAADIGPLHCTVAALHYTAADRTVVDNVQPRHTAVAGTRLKVVARTPPQVQQPAVAAPRVLQLQLQHLQVIERTLGGTQHYHPRPWGTLMARLFQAG